MIREQLATLAGSIHPELATAISQLHFIRADWFYALMPLALFLLWLYKRPGNHAVWAGIVDARLAPFVLSGSAGKSGRWHLLLVFIAGMLAITALAGPVYKQLPQPVFREISSLVIILDLSRSMNAEDVKPSRLQRARLELLDILNSRKTGQTALVVYAADAFVVTPLTDDIATISNLVPSLETAMMPAQGSNLGAALSKTHELLSQSGVRQGDVLLITDAIDARHQQSIEKLASQGHRLSVFGIGTAQGSPVPLLASETGGFLLDDNGAIVIPRLDEASLRRMAMTGGGLYISLAADDSDTRRLLKLLEASLLDPANASLASDSDSKPSHDSERDADIWQEEGYWLLIPLLLLASLWFRKGWLAVFVIACLPVTEPAYADSLSDNSLALDNLWLTPDQQAMKAFNAGDHEAAASRFSTPEWQASARYRQGDYQGAASLLQDIETSSAHYNRGNALAKLGQYEQALQAYDRALSLDSSNEDAAFNREQVEQALAKQKQQASQQQDKQAGDNSQNRDEQPGEQTGEQQDKQQGQASGEQDASGKPTEQQNAEQSGAQDSDQQTDTDQQAQAQDEDQKMDQGVEQNTRNETMSEAQQQAMDEAEEKALQQRNAEQERQQAEQEMQDYQQSRQRKDEQDADKQADAQPAREQQDLEQQDPEQQNQEQQAREVEMNPSMVEASITEKEQATRQWLRRIPDDPGGLLRRKFYYQYKQMPDQRDADKPW